MSKQVIRFFSSLLSLRIVNLWWEEKRKSFLFLCSVVHSIDVYIIVVDLGQLYIEIHHWKTFHKHNFLSLKLILIEIFLENLSIRMSSIHGNCCFKLNYFLCGTKEISPSKRKISSRVSYFQLNRISISKIKNNNRSLWNEIIYWLTFIEIIVSFINK